MLLLDLGLPDASGLDVIREIRAATGPAPAFDPDLPIVALSGRGGDDDRVRGLREGADDYLVKPFHYAELHERIGKLLAPPRRPRRGPDPDRLLLDRPGDRARSRSASATVALAEQGVRAAAGARRASRRGCSPRRSCCATSGAYETLGRTRTLDSHASRLRRKLDPERGRYVINCWGVGYRLVEG